MHSTNKCPLCENEETSEHLIQCKHSSRTPWKCGLIRALRTKMENTNTSFSLTETFVSAISDWMENGFIDLRKYPERFREAIHQQDRIGWNHLFAGKISQAWLQMYEDTYVKPRSSGTHHHPEGFVWGAHLVKIILQNMIILWEQQNKDIHGDTDENKDRILKEKLKSEFLSLNSLQDQCRPRDQFLFQDDPEEFLKRSTAKQVATYITTSKRAIINSYNKWKQHTAAGVRSVIGWLVADDPNNEDTFIKL